MSSPSLSNPPGFFGDIFHEGEADEVVFHAAVHFHDLLGQCFAVVEIVACVEEQEVLSYHGGDEGGRVRGVGDNTSPGVLQQKHPSQVEC